MNIWYFASSSTYENALSMSRICSADDIDVAPQPHFKITQSLEVHWMILRIVMLDQDR